MLQQELFLLLKISFVFLTGGTIPVEAYTDETPAASIPVPANLKN
jgi:hypothetical protein